MMHIFEQLARTRLEAAMLGFFMGIAVTVLAFAIALPAGLRRSLNGGAR